MASGQPSLPETMRQDAPRKLVTVAIVEDHPEFRSALSSAISATPDLRLVAVIKDLPAGMGQLEQACPDVLLVDLGLPSGSGLSLIHKAHAHCGTKCVSAVLTVTGNEEYLLPALAAGAKGYLFKSDQPADWCQAIRMLGGGQSPLHAQLAQALLQSSRMPAVPPDERKSSLLSLKFDRVAQSILQYVAAGYTCPEAAEKLKMSSEAVGMLIRGLYDQLVLQGPGLSPRELQLLQLLDEGYPFKKCAELMGVSESTTKTQAARANEKLRAANLQSALYEARQAGLLS